MWGWLFGFFYRKDRDDVGVVEGGDGTSFALEAREAVGIVGHLSRQHLESHVTAELRVIGAIHLPHAARADRRGDVVVGERAADQIEPPGARKLSDCRFVSGRTPSRFYTPGRAANLLRSVQKLSFNANCRFLGGNVSAASPNRARLTSLWAAPLVKANAKFV